MEAPPLAKALRSGQYSDLTLECRGKEWKVHKAIVCSYSPVIAAAVNGDFVEARTGVYKITNFDQPTVGRFLDYLYTHDYTASVPGNERDESELVAEPVEGQDQDDAMTEAGVEGSGDEEPQSATQPTKGEEDASMTETASMSGAVLLLHVRVNAIGDYFDVPGLRKLSTEKIKSMIEEDWTPDSFVKAVAEASGSTNDCALHKTLAHSASKHIGQLIELDSFLHLDALSPFARASLQFCVLRMLTAEEASESLDLALKQKTSDLHAEVERRSAAERSREAVQRNLKACRDYLAQNESCGFPCSAVRHSVYLGDESDFKGTIPSSNWLLKCKSCSKILVKPGFTGFTFLR